MMSGTNFEFTYWTEARVGYLRWTVRIVSVVTLLAFVAALMPDSWFVWNSQQLGQSFPQQPLGFYLARNLSAMYGFVGAGLWVLTTNMHRFGPLFPWVAWAAVAFGALQLVLDYLAGLPWWWTIAEGGSTIIGGVLLLAMVAWCRDLGGSSRLANCSEKP